MSLSTSKAIRTRVATKIEDLTGVRTLDYMPVDIDDLFEELPCHVVDYTSSQPQVFEKLDQGAFKTALLEIRTYRHVNSNDTTGREASEALADLQDELEALLVAQVSLWGAVDAAALVERQPAEIALESEKSGIMARFGWIQVAIAHPR